ncbi:MAG: 50S ribosomal protein L31e [Candidatus Bathyarchaeia archaeon]
MREGDQTMETGMEEKTEKVAEETTRSKKGEVKEVREAEPAKVKKDKAKEMEEEILEEKIYTIPLGRVWNIQQPYRTPKSIKLVRDYVKRHMKVDVVKLHDGLNRFMWRRGIEKPPRRVRVRATKDKEGNVTVYLAEGKESRAP